LEVWELFREPID
jgi:hypothetical protein